MQTTFFQQETVKSSHQFFDNLKLIAGPYWYPTDPKEGRKFSEVISSWGMLFLLLLVIVGLVASNAVNSFVNRYLVDVIIQDKNASKFLTILLFYGLGLLLITLFTA
ncbi:MAG: ABC transporter ATP-binding protein/permease, partial [Microcystis panniformis]